jgi:hypothetical protein
MEVLRENLLLQLGGHAGVKWKASSGGLEGDGTVLSSSSALCVRSVRGGKGGKEVTQAVRSQVLKWVPETALYGP